MKRINAMTIVLVIMLMLAGCAVVTDDRTMPIHESDFIAAGWDKQRLDDAFRLAQ